MADNNDKRTLTITFKTKKELADEYGISTKTVSRYCRMIEINTRKMLTPGEVRKFYKHFNDPF